MTDDAPGLPQSFIRSLWCILNDTANADIIGWRADGASFAITDVQRFEEQIMPRYFLTRRITSFIRQLTAYGFVSLRGEAAGDDIAAHKYRHDTELFRRDQPLLSLRIARQKRKRRPKQRRGSSKRRSVAADQDDDDDSFSGESAPSEKPPASDEEDERRRICMQLEAQHRRIAHLRAEIARLEADLL